MSKPRKLKSAPFPIPQTHDEANTCLGAIGALRRERDRLETEMNDRLAALKAEYEERARPATELLAQREKALKAYCDAHRAELLKGESKTYRFAAGEISWRTRPPKITVKNTLKAISWYAQHGMRVFLRLKEELNKDEMQKWPGTADQNPFIKIGSEGEQFYIKPFEAELEEPAKESA